MFNPLLAAGKSITEKSKSAGRSLSSGIGGTVNAGKNLTKSVAEKTKSALKKDQKSGKEGEETTAVEDDSPKTGNLFSNALKAAKKGASSENLHPKRSASKEKLDKSGSGGKDKKMEKTGVKPEKSKADKSEMSKNDVSSRDEKSGEPKSGGPKRKKGKSGQKSGSPTERKEPKSNEAKSDVESEMSGHSTLERKPHASSSHDKLLKSHNKSRKSKHRKLDGSKDSDPSSRSLATAVSPGDKVPSEAEKYSQQGSSASDLMDFDVTQWERSRFYKDSKKTTKDDEKVEVAGASGSKKGGPESVVGEPILGEVFQETAERGEYLKEKPKRTLILLAAEAVISVVSLIVWAAAADNPILPQMLSLFNLIIVLIVILAVTAVEYLRIHVVSVEDAADTRWKVPYMWRYQLSVAHVARAVLLCASITQMALDKDFDAGSIVVLSVQPIHLIIVGVHLFAAFRPKAKQG